MLKWKQRELLVPQASLSRCFSPDPLLHRAVAALSTQNQPQRLGAVPAPRRPHRGHQLVHADLHQAARVLSCVLSCSWPWSSRSSPSSAAHASVPGLLPQDPPRPTLYKEAAPDSCSSQPAGTELLIAFATISGSGRGNRLQIKRSITIFLIDALEPYFRLPRSDGCFFGGGSWLGLLCAQRGGSEDKVTFWCSDCPVPSATSPRGVVPGVGRGKNSGNQLLPKSFTKPMK